MSHPQTRTARISRTSRPRLRAAAAAAVLAAGGAATLVGAGAVAGPAQAASFYRTVGTDVNMRGCASTSCKVIYTFHTRGTAVYPRCYTTGASVNGDNVWYYTGYTTPSGSSVYYGYIAGYWLDTGHDPASGISRC